MTPFPVTRTTATAGGRLCAAVLPHVRRCQHAAVGETEAPSRPERTADARHLAVFFGIVAVSVGLPLLLAVLTGSIGIPHNDAWSHSKIAQEFAHTWSIDLVGWNRTALVGQIVVLGPLGASIVVQQLSVALLAVVALGATHEFLFRRVGPGGALLGTALIGFNPEFGLLATSYMSDMPALAALLVCLVLTDRALARESLGYLVAALAVGLWGVTIREQALVGPAVAVAVTVLAWRGRKRVVAACLGLVAAGLVVLFELWRRALPFGDPAPFDLDLSAMLDPGIQCAFTIALYVAPAALLVARPWSWTGRARWSALATLVVSVVIAFRRDGDVFLGNYLAQHGAYSAAAQGTRDAVIPSWWWTLLTLLACVSAASIVGALVNSGLHLDRVAALAGILFVLGTLGQMAVGQGVHGRGLLPLIPVVCAALLPRRAANGGGRNALAPAGSSWQQVTASMSALVLLLITAIGLTANAVSFDAARWQAAAAIQDTGVPATRIDGGLEWTGYHATGPGERFSGNPDALGWHIKMFPDSRQCYLVTASPLDEDALGGPGPDGAARRTLIGTHEYRTYAVFGSSSVWIYRDSMCG